MNDTDATEKVAQEAKDSPDTIEKPRLFPSVLDLTEPQGYMIEAFDLWTRAQSDPVFLDHLHTWENLRFCIDAYLDGQCDYEDCVQAVGKERASDYLAAIVTIGKLFPLFAPKRTEDK